jgi:hypothetical protein
MWHAGRRPVVAGDFVLATSWWVAADLDLQCRVAHPGGFPFLYQAENAFDCFGLLAYPGLLTLIICQTVHDSRHQDKCSRDPLWSAINAYLDGPLTVAQ